jgi:hypothetical protein
MLGKLKCLLGMHKRSRSRMVRDEDRFRSVCHRCEIPMVGDQADWHDGWRVDSPAETSR